MTKRGHDEGSITKRERASGRECYEISVSLPPHRDTGVRTRKTTTFYGSYKDAKKELTKQLAEIHRGVVVDPSRATVADLARDWLADEAGPRVKASTLNDYEENIRNHLIPRLGTIRAQSLTARDVHRVMAEMHREEVGVRTQQLMLSRLKQILSWAATMELVARNVAEDIKPPASETRKARAMSHAELRSFLAAAKDDLYWPLWLVYATTGLRRGEGLGVRWGDLDLHKRQLSVRQAVGLVKGGDGVVKPRIQQPKSRAAIRTLDLDSETVLVLERHHEVAEPIERGATYWEPNDLVFCTRHGTPHNPNNLYEDHFNVIRENAGLDDSWDLHELRHTHASHLILAGVPITEIARRLGHADASITLRVYGHMIEDHKGQAVAAIEDMLLRRDLPELGAD